MNALYHISYSGDYRGTALEVKLKKYVREKYDHTICTDAAILQIFHDIENYCAGLMETAPRCKPVHVALNTPGEYLPFFCIYITGENQQISASLLNFGKLKSCYISNEGVTDIFRGYEMFHENMDLTRIDLKDCTL